MSASGNGNENGNGHGNGHGKHYPWSLTTHHVIPRSRLNGHVVVIPRKIHELFHWIFGNLTPVEVIIWLVERVWGGRWAYVEQALEWKERRDMQAHPSDRRLKAIDGKVRMSKRMPDGRRPHRLVLKAMIQERHGLTTVDRRLPD